MNEQKTRDQLDLLHHIETLTKGINEQMSNRSKSVLSRYPLTFTLIALFGVVAVSEGIKGILEKITFFQSEPTLLLFFGLFVLTILGSLYRKLS